MAFWNRKPAGTLIDDLGVPGKTVAPDGAKSVVFTDDLTSAILNWGAYGFGSSYELMYRRQPAVRTVVDFLARNVAQLTLKAYLRLGNDDRLELDTHPLAQLLRQPNPSTSRYRFMEDTVADKAIHGRAYWRLDRPMLPRAIMRVPPSSVIRQKEGDSFVYRGPDGKEIPRNLLVVFSSYSPDGAWKNEDGVSPLETLRRVLAEEWAAQEHRANFWNNAARVAGVIERPLDAPEWSDNARDRFRADWQNAMTGGANSGKTGILEEGMTWKSDAFSPKDSEYIAGRQLAFEEVARSYGVAPKLFGMGDIANANIDSFHRQLYQDTLGPLLKEFQDDIELQLLPKVDTTGERVYIEFNLDAKLKGSFEEQMRTLVTAVGVPFVGVNEARARVNLPRVDEDSGAFDQPIQPLNVMYGGQPAVTVPTEVPQPKMARRKAVVPAGPLRRRDEAAAEMTELFRRHFRAQRQAMKSKATPPDTDRWNQQLTGQLYAAKVTLARKTGQRAAEQTRGVYDETLTFNYLQETSRVQAETINKHTADALRDGDPDTVFDIATTSRADYLGLSTATQVIAFARTEAGKQSEAADGRQRTKTWIVTSRKSRHPELDGETVGVQDDFSNGLPWPGAAGGSPDETAGCACLLQLD